MIATAVAALCARGGKVFPLDNKNSPKDLEDLYQFFFSFFLLATEMVQKHFIFLFDL